MALAACGGSVGEKPLLTTSQPPQTTASEPSVARPARTQEHLKLIGAYGGVYANPQIEAMVNGLVERLVAVSSQPDREMRVTILNSPAVNAFALPSGDLFVTRGLIALANDESELAAVIAHEISHVTADHARLRQRQAQAAALAKRVSDVVTDPSIKADSRETAELSLATFSQQQELEADEIGVKTLAAAGFDPFAAARFLNSMARFAQLPSLNAASEDGPGFLSSHPSTPARVDHAKRVARSFGAPGLGRTAHNNYLRTLDGTLYGDDPREGFVRGREFAHVELGIAFTVPDNYVLKNTSAAVLATDGAHTAIRFDAVAVPESESLAQYLRSGWVKGLIDDSIRSETVDGLEAAVASALVEGWSFRIGVVRGPRRVYRFIFASSKPAAAYEEAFRSTMNSFRLLSPSQRAAMRPLRIRVIPVRPNESVETLAKRMQGVDEEMKRPLFETLNGLGEDRPLAPGDLVKITTE
ncbi:M48 family metalloprotease [Acuticoccus sp. M5D2P5]|uniref:M48 family metalloprotease n=1 Tax=Acuticoccus kalidii TaxID=2910977 RepID=UPI001F1CCC14|nr:M48 family metalloprotease [Acuticoccus kalidii]MCF3933369.1 M48 family metalloprotease [Acuticoccus kalidii]